MLIRKPVLEVFVTFIDPAITNKFWFTKGTGINEGESLHGTWEMYNSIIPVGSQVIAPNK